MSIPFDPSPQLLAFRTDNLDVPFDHEKLDVYKVSLDLVAAVEEVVDAFPPGRAYLADQLRRCSNSIPSNIGEAAGEFAKTEKARIYRIARRSATECAAQLDVCLRLGLTDSKKHEVGRNLLLRIVSMLTRMVRTLGGHPRRAGRAAATRSGTGTGTGTGAEQSG